MINDSINAWANDSLKGMTNESGNSMINVLILVIALLTLWATIIGLREGTIRNFFRKCGELLDNFYSSIDFPRRRLNHKINSKDFLAWQDEMLKKIYTEKNFTKILGTDYPVHCIPFDQNYDLEKADSLCKQGKEFLLPKVIKDLPQIYNSEIMEGFSVSDTGGRKEEIALKKRLMGKGFFRKGYKWFTARSMRDGNHIGFVLDHLDFDGDKIKKIHLSVGDYELNVLTSHILTYELFKVYEQLLKDAKKKYNKDDIDKYLYEIDINSVLWPKLPFRRYIHRQNRNNINEVLYSGKGRFSLLSVQCLVIINTSEDGDLEYKTFLGKRSESTRKVSTKLGHYQFPPSGGFDLYEKEKLNYKKNGVLEKNCSLTMALMREYLEELFDENKCSKVDDTNYLASYASIAELKDDGRIKDIRKLLKTDIEDKRFKAKTRKAYFTTVGANVDLIDLRLSVNFLLVINDYEYFSQNKKLFKFNEEIETNEEGEELKMLMDWKSVDETLKGKRHIVEDSVALYAQGKQAFRDYLETVVVDENCIKEICNDQ